MKIKVKNGEKVVIELARKKPVAQSPRSKAQVSEPAKGIIRPKREQEYLARRKKPQGIIRLFDLGRKRTSPGGEFESIIYETATRHEAFSPGGTIGGIRFFYPYESDYEALENEMVSIPGGEILETACEQIPFDDASEYWIDLVFHDGGGNEKTFAYAKTGEREYLDSESAINQPEFKAAGLVNPSRPGKPKLRLRNFAFFESFDTGNEDGYKVTTELHYDADEAAMPDLSRGGFDLFLVPALRWLHGRQSAGFQNGGDSLANFYLTNLPRNIRRFIEKNADDPGFARLSNSDESKTFNTSLLAENPDARAIYLKAGQPLEIHSGLSDWLARFNGFTPGVPQLAFVSGAMGDAIETAIDPVNGLARCSRLVAVFKKGVNYYYVWRTASLRDVPPGEQDIFTDGDLPGWNPS
ncbi:MAG TPA: hypothetical protein VF556_04200 [Pyrinomonadaceae bacterium]